MVRVWRAGSRHDPFNNACANPTRALCGASAVVSARSVGPARHDYFLFYKKLYIYICTIYIHYYKLMSMIFYWLDNFV
jgi:hypothetical protein